MTTYADVSSTQWLLVAIICISLPVITWLIALNHRTPVPEPKGFTIWVCEDCYESHHGVFDRVANSLAPPLGRIPEGYHLTSGLWPHDESCPNVVDGEWMGEHDCDCEIIHFSKSPCEGCGSTLAGVRYALTLWERAA